MSDREGRGENFSVALYHLEIRAASFRGASQEVFGQLLAVSPMTVRSREQGLRQPSPIARRFLDEIEVSPEHSRGRLLAATADTPPPSRIGRPADQAKNARRRSP